MGRQGALQANSLVPLTCAHNSLSAVLFSGKTGYSEWSVPPQGLINIYVLSLYAFQNGGIYRYIISIQFNFYGIKIVYIFII